MSVDPKSRFSAFHSSVAWSLRRCVFKIYTDCMLSVTPQHLLPFNQARGPKYIIPVPSYLILIGCFRQTRSTSNQGSKTEWEQLSRRAITTITATVTAYRVWILR